MIEYDQENFTVFMSFHKKCIVSSILYSLTLFCSETESFTGSENIQNFEQKINRKICNFRIIRFQLQGPTDQNQPFGSGPKDRT